MKWILTGCLLGLVAQQLVLWVICEIVAQSLAFEVSRGADDPSFSELILTRRNWILYALAFWALGALILNEAIFREHERRMTLVASFICYCLLNSTIAILACILPRLPHCP